MHYSLALGLLVSCNTAAFPFVIDVPGVDSSWLTNKREFITRASPDTCPFNPNHPGAIPVNDKYPYLKARNGLPGTGIGGIQVPAPGDTAHYFQAPGPRDIRGPCPGLNTAANHNFISHDGITTFNELIDMVQNVFNIGYDLAHFLATAGVGLDGDLISGKLSIGCDATGRTSATKGLLGPETGLNGHNKFEADASLTRNDYFLANGDNYRFNGTLFRMMNDTCKGHFDIDCLALYRQQRYKQSKRENGEFFFGPASLLLYGAASLVYETLPSFGPKGVPDVKTMQSFFGATEMPDGTFEFNNREKIPPNWHNRVVPYDVADTGVQILAMYAKKPVQFGINAGQDNFNAMNFSSYIVDGKLKASTGPEVMCFFYQILTSGIPTGISTVYKLPAGALEIALKKLGPGYKNLGCSRPLYPGHGG